MSIINSGSGRNLNVSLHYESNVNKLAEDANVIENLTTHIEKLEVTIKQQANTIENYASELDIAQNKIEELTSGSEWQKMSEKAQRATRLASQSYQELLAFLETHHLRDVLDQDWVMDDIADNVRNGRITVGQAISEIKLTYRELLESEKEGFDTSILQNFMSTLNELSAAVSRLEDKLLELEQNGIKTIGNAGTEGTGNLASLFESISGASNDMTKSVEAAFQPITNLVGAVAQYQSIDTEKIQAISSTFRNLAATTSNSLGDKTTNNVIKLLTDLQAVTAGKPINIAMNVSGIEELKVKKTSLNNLATYLPEIAKVNVNKLKELSNVDLTNFNNVKVSKGAVEEISKIANAVQILREAKAASVNVNGNNIKIDRTVNQALREQEALEREVAAATKEWEASQKSAAEQAARVVTPLQQQINALVGIDSATKSAEESALRLKDNTLTETQATRQAEGALKEMANAERLAAEQAAQVVTPLQQQINALVGIGKEAKSAEKSANVFKAEAQAAKEAEVAERQSLSYRKKATSLLAEMAKAQNSWTKASKGSTKEQFGYITAAIPELQKLMQSFEAGEIPLSDFKKKIDEMSISFKQNSTIIKEAGENTLSFGDRIQKLSGKFGAWLSITRIIMGVIRTIKQMVKTTIEIDSAMTQLQIVTKANDKTMAKFGETAANISKQIGSAITDFTSSVTTFARLGYNLDESSALAKYTAMLQNVGDIDVSDAQDSITSIIKAFNISTDQIESTMDKLVVTGKLLPGHTVMCA